MHCSLLCSPKMLNKTYQLLTSVNFTHQHAFSCHFMAKFAEITYSIHCILTNNKTQFKVDHNRI